ncbi:MAG: MinD/ParA family protein [Dethiobacteraceae bacterium]
MDQAERLRQLVWKQQTAPTVLKAKNKSRVITVTSGKGGVGKTSLVVNLAIALSLLGKRVMVLDADLGLANVDIMLGLLPQHTLHDVVRGTKSLADIALDGPAGIRLLPGGSGLSELADLGEKQRKALIDKLAALEESADILLIDTGAGLSRTVLSFVAAADEMLLITTPEPTAIRDAYGMVKVAATQQLQQKIGLVVNLISSEREGKEIAERLLTVSQQFLQVELQYLGGIRADAHVVTAVKQQQPFYLHSPRCRAAGNIRQIAGALLSLPPEQPRGFSGFFNRLAQLWDKV